VPVRRGKPRRSEPDVVAPCPSTCALAAAARRVHIGAGGSRGRQRTPSASLPVHHAHHSLSPPGLAISISPINKGRSNASTADRLRELLQRLPPLPLISSPASTYRQGREARATSSGERIGAPTRYIHHQESRERIDRCRACAALRCR
jgi:hypothetical protein